MVGRMPARTKYRRYREIADLIARRIGAGIYATGERLPSERELVEELGVSRPTLREALIALEIMGHLDIRGGSGIYVVDGADQHAARDLGIGTFELLEARKIIEADVAAIAARYIDNDQARRLRHLVEQQIKGLEEDSGLFDAADKDFHIFIAEISGNGALLHVIEELWKFRQESDIWRMIDKRADAYSLRGRAVEDHIRITSAMEARDPDASFKAMSQHIQNNLDWRLSNILDVPALSDKDRRTKLRLRLAREVEQRADEGARQEKKAPSL